MCRDNEKEQPRQRTKRSRDVVISKDIKPAEKRDYTMSELRLHDSSDPTKPILLAINDNVYDITRWISKHPGGKAQILHCAGEDATDSFVAFHPERSVPEKYMKSIYIGKLIPDPKYPEPEHVMEFRELRAKFEKQGLFNANPLFYLGHLAHVIGFEMVAWYIMTTWSTSWAAWLFGCFLLGSGQAQAGWLQHDFGHLAVFKSRKLNHYAHKFVICFLKAASSEWWNYRHFRHHGKPNAVMKDPDVTLPYVFLLGEEPAKKWGQSRKGIMPYNLQHHYWFLIGPPMLLPTYFHYENLRFVFLKKHWDDLLLMFLFFVRYMVLFAPTFGFGGTIGIYFFQRFLESHWFVWVTQMSHIPMKIVVDERKDWVARQAEATCNVHPSTFNDWFTGHLNFQIEHHLFPTMPRHNLIKTRPAVMALFKKHNIPYVSKSLWRAFADIVSSLRTYGSAWGDAYYHN